VAPAGATPARPGRFPEQHRLQVLKGRLAQVEARLAAGRVSVTRGGRELARLRQQLEAAGLSEAQWRERREAERLFITADGEADKCQELSVMPSADPGCTGPWPTPEAAAHPGWGQDAGSVKGRGGEPGPPKTVGSDPMDSPKCPLPRNGGLSSSRGRDAAPEPRTKHPTWSMGGWAPAAQA